MAAPCRECPFREVGCHGKCELYREWLAKIRARKHRNKGEAEVRDYEIKNQYFRQDGHERYRH